MRWKAERPTHGGYAWVQTVKLKVDDSRLRWTEKFRRVQLNVPAHDILVGFLIKSVPPTGCAEHSEPEKKVPRKRQGIWPPRLHAEEIVYRPVGG